MTARKLGKQQETTPTTLAAACLCPIVFVSFVLSPFDAVYPVGFVQLAQQ